MISVVIPFYNRAGTIVDSVESVLLQSLKPSEVILVDDGSTDGGPELVLEKFGSSVRILSTGGRKGACYARNLGLKSAKFDLVAFQDSDDIWFHNKLKKQIDLIESTDSDICFSSFIRSCIGGKSQICPLSEDIMFSVSEDGVVDALKAVKVAYRKNHLSTQTLLLRKSRVNIMFDESLPRFQDWDFYLSCIFSGLKICYLNEPTALVRVQGDSITNNIEAGITARNLIKSKYYKGFLGVSDRMRFEFDLFLRRLYFFYDCLKKRI
jgi:glycosyltransferase involved in cell wall biosynthesis